MVPQGDTVTLPAGSYGYITQALGGSYSVFVEGNLFRIAGKDGDAIGRKRRHRWNCRPTPPMNRWNSWYGSSCAPASTPKFR